MGTELTQAKIFRGDIFKGELQEAENNLNTWLFVNRDRIKVISTQAIVGYGILIMYTEYDYPKGNVLNESNK